MLQGLLSGKEKSQVIVIEDHYGTSGICLLKAFLIDLAKRLTKIHLVLLEYDEEKLLSTIPSNTRGVLEVHNVAKDPLGWHSENSLTMDADFVGHITGRVDSVGDRKCAVLFDSVSNLICHRSAAFTCQTLQRLILKTKDKSEGPVVEQVVAMVHRDLHDPAALGVLRHTASTVLTLLPPVTDTFQAACHSLHKKTSGKVSRLKEQFRIGQDYNSVEIQEIVSLSDSVPADKGPDPTANLTFNLSLSEKEKSARSQVELPYTQRQGADPEKSAGSGKIFYQPDEADDFDEEDPDDDLDI